MFKKIHNHRTLGLLLNNLKFAHVVKKSRDILKQTNLNLFCNQYVVYNFKVLNFVENRMSLT